MILSALPQKLQCELRYAGVASTADLSDEGALNAKVRLAELRVIQQIEKFGPELRADWDAEVGEMRARINRIRAQIAAADPRLAYIGGQFGMFSMLPVSKEQVVQLREQHAIYMADSGRFNVIGMADHAVDRFIAAVVEAMNV